MMEAGQHVRMIGWDNAKNCNIRVTDYRDELCKTVVKKEADPGIYEGSFIFFLDKNYLINQVLYDIVRIIKKKKDKQNIDVIKSKQFKFHPLYSHKGFNDLSFDLDFYYTEECSLFTFKENDWKNDVTIININQFEFNNMDEFDKLIQKHHNKIIQFYVIKVYVNTLNYVDDSMSENRYDDINESKCYKKFTNVLSDLGCQICDFFSKYYLDEYYKENDEFGQITNKIDYKRVFYYSEKQELDNRMDTLLCKRCIYSEAKDRHDYTSNKRCRNFILCSTIYAKALDRFNKHYQENIKREIYDDILRKFFYSLSFLPDEERKKIEQEKQPIEAIICPLLEDSSIQEDTLDHIEEIFNNLNLIDMIKLMITDYYLLREYNKNEEERKKIFSMIYKNVFKLDKLKYKFLNNIDDKNDDDYDEE